jgi:hypothetical protein
MKAENFHYIVVLSEIKMKVVVRPVPSSRLMEIYYRSSGLDIQA